MTHSTVTSPTSALPAGARLYRHVMPLATPMSPVAVAAALRPAGRVMLTAGSDGRHATVAAGELAVLSHPGGAGHAPLADAVDFLAALNVDFLQLFAEVRHNAFHESGPTRPVSYS